MGEVPTETIQVDGEAAASSGTGLRLWRGVDGQLWGETRALPARAVQACRLFPWSHPQRWVSLRDGDDEELALVGDPAELAGESRAALEASLAEAGFVMEIERIDAIDEEIEIRTFFCQTQQGPRRFQTERDAWPRELESGGVLLRDVAGDLYAIREPEKLDAQSRKLLSVLID